MTLQQILAGVLLIGNIGIKEDPNDAEKCSHRIMPTIHRIGLCSRLAWCRFIAFPASNYDEIDSGGGSARIKSIAYRPYTVREAIDVRDALAKELYKELSCASFTIDY